MRISAGTLKGLKLHTPGQHQGNNPLRPTSSRIRESMFDILTHGSLGNCITHRRVLDLFAGTGALGIEALSRGAASVTFVEKNRCNLDLLTRNVSKANVRNNSSIVQADATRLPPNKRGVHDLIFLDPPYGQDLHEGSIRSALKGGWMTPECVLVLETGKPVSTSSFWLEHIVRKYGTTYITIGRVKNTVLVENLNQ